MQSLKNGLRVIMVKEILYNFLDINFTQMFLIFIKEHIKPDMNTENNLRVS